MDVDNAQVLDGELIHGDEQNYITVNRSELVQYIDTILRQSSVDALRKQVKNLEVAVKAFDEDLVFSSGQDGLSLKLEPLLTEIRQMSEARTVERAHYYAQRLRKSLFETKANEINDINIKRWKDYDEISTDSLWIINRRDGSGAHLGRYWGNFIPQIPRQLMMRYTKKGDLVVDPFVGSGTTLIECRRLGRHGFGVEINPDTADNARELIASEANAHDVATRLTVGDSKVYDFRTAIQSMGFEAIDLLLMHPPYHDIIRFSSDSSDLSSAGSTEEFLRMFGEVLDNTLPLLKRNRFVCIVIGDKYDRGEWIPLGFYCMQEAMKRRLSLKSIVVKNFEETRGKRNQKSLWRYRALLGGFYLFKHEYILILRKT